jgi:ABC-2 type transport system permease protein
MSLGFLIASMVPTARFAQPIATMIVYPMLGLSGLFLSVEALPPAVQVVARLLPLTYAVSLLQGIWHGEGWMAHIGDAGVLVLTSLVLTTISARVFRWE